LVAELVASLNEAERSPALVRAAMAQLNLVMIHPFQDGNGRMARDAQDPPHVRMFNGVSG